MGIVVCVCVCVAWFPGTLLVGTSTYKFNLLPSSGDDVGRHVLGCRVDILGTNCEQGLTSPYILHHGRDKPG